MGGFGVDDVEFDCLLFIMGELLLFVRYVAHCFSSGEIVIEPHELIQLIISINQLTLLYVCNGIVELHTGNGPESLQFRATAREATCDPNLTFIPRLSTPPRRVVHS